jgi:RNA polymerase sigma-70 factor (ECF subfamily)
MSLERPELQSLLERVRQGDGEAARELLIHFEPHVRRVVRRRLPVVMRSKFDSMDFVQSVWGDFFPKLARGEITFDSPQRLAKFLALVAQAKVTNEFRRRFGKKLDIHKEVAMGNALIYVPGETGDPTPSQNLAANERMEAILSGRPELHKRLLELRSQGFTFDEIAEKLDITERTARRILHEVEKDLRLNDAGQ